MKKDFTQIETNRVYNAITEATQEAQDAQEEHSKRKERRTYTAQEAQDFSNEGKTRGRKGLGLDRINMGFLPANYAYIKTMSRVRGENMTEFVNTIITDHRKRNADLFNEAQKFIDGLK